MAKQNYDRNDLTLAFIYGIFAGMLLLGIMLGIIKN